MHRARAFFFVCAGIFLLAVAYCHPAQAEQLFQEHFDSMSLDTTKWVLDLGDGQLSLSGSCAVLTCPGGEFPFFTTRLCLRTPP